MISAPSNCLHLDDNIYENAAKFDPFRFARMRETEGEGTKHQFVSTSLDYLPFGHGRNAWYVLFRGFSCALLDAQLVVSPGRFFVANQMKTMLAHIVLAYDVKLEGKSTVPESIHDATSIVVNPNVNVMIRKRK